MPMGYAYIVDKIEVNGEREAVLRTARDLLEELDDKAISNTTGLSINEVAKLREESNK